MKKIFLFILVAICLNSCERKPGISNTKGTNYRLVQNQQLRNIEQYPDETTSKPQIPTHGITGNAMSGSEIFEKYNSAVFMIYTSDGYNNYQGSGFFISPDGIAVSSYHVFKGTSIGSEQIKLFNDSAYKIRRVIAKNEADDIIIFEVQSNGDRFNYIPIATKLPRIGEKAYAIGSPRGLENTFSSGEISQLRGDTYMQISVPIDHGSSGGALLNTFGEAIGITSAGLDDSVANLNFAVNIKVLRKYIQ